MKLVWAVVGVAIVATLGATQEVRMKSPVRLLQSREMFEYSGIEPFFFRWKSFTGKFISIDRREPVDNPDFAELDIVDIWIREENGNIHFVQGFRSRKLSDVEIHRLVNREESQFPQDVYGLRALATFF